VFSLRSLELLKEKPLGRASLGAAAAAWTLDRWLAQLSAPAGGEA
jgi:hypothetical protein